MNMRIKTILATTAIATATAFTGTVGAAAAADDLASNQSPTEVTIKGQNGDYHGKVKSSNPDCLANRKVKVYKMLGDSPAPKTDQKIGTDVSELDGTKGVWSIGNSGFKHGDFYAKVKRTSECAGDISPVLSR
jgi:hypothetical protein